jgi:Catenin-beta-like, Arm-motif containing nuclear
VAGSPELYPEFVRTSAVPTLLALLSHENSDIACDVIELFQELTDSDAVEDSVRLSVGHCPSVGRPIELFQELANSDAVEDSVRLSIGLSVRPLPHRVLPGAGSGILCVAANLGTSVEF